MAKVAGKVTKKVTTKANLKKIAKTNAKIVKTKPNIEDKSLSPVVIKPTRNSKSGSTEAENVPKSVERVIDIREIKKQAEKIIQEKKLQSQSPVSSLRVSPRKKVLSSPVTSTPETRPRRGKVETISDGPTVSLVSQNKIHKNLLRSVQKRKSKIKKKPLKENAILKINEKAKNQEIIQKLSKILLKNKCVTKLQLNNLLQRKSDFKAVTILAGLLKAKKKLLAEGQKNQWKVCPKEEEEEEEVEEEEEEPSYEMVDDEDQDRDYVPGEENTPMRRFLPSSVSTIKAPKTTIQRMITPIKPHSNVKSNKDYTPVAYQMKPNNLANGDMPLYPIDNVKRLVGNEKMVSKMQIKSLSRSGDISLFEDGHDESIHSISALLEQTKDYTPPLGRSSLSASQEYPSYYCNVCSKTYKNKANFMKHQNTWLHRFQMNATITKSPDVGETPGRELGEKRDVQLISQIKQEMLRTMSSQINLSPPNKGGTLFRPNMSSNKFILDSELNLSLVVDSLNLILTNDVEDDEDAYDTLQMALGASTADMNLLKTLAGQTINKSYVYDSGNPSCSEGIFDPNESALLIEEYRHDQVDIDMETRALGCPSTECNKTFFGLVGLQTHIKYWHRNEVFLQRKTTYRFLHGPEPLKYVCFVCKEMFLSAADREDHIESEHRALPADNSEAAAYLLKALCGIIERTLKKCVANEEKRKKKKEEGKSGGEKSAEGEAVEGNDLVEEIDVKSELEETEFDEYEQLTQMGADFIRKLKASEDGLRAYELLVRLVNPTESEENRAFVQLLICKLQTILGKVVKSSLLPISNQIVISSRQQHNVYNSDSRERRHVCPICEIRFLTQDTRNKHFSKAHPQERKKLETLAMEEQAKNKTGEKKPGKPSTDRINALLDRMRESDKPLLQSVTSPPLDKAEVLNELKIRLANKEKRKRQSIIAEAVCGAEEEEEEEEMLALEEEYLVEEEDDEMEEQEAVRMSRGNKDLQQMIREIQGSIQALKPPPSTGNNTLQPTSATRSNKLSCNHCARGFINEDELFHHKRLEHSENTLVSKLTELKKKSQPVSTSPQSLAALQASSPALGISPIKPVRVAAVEDASATPGKQLAPLLTRRELQQTASGDRQTRANTATQGEGRQTAVAKASKFEGGVEEDTPEDSAKTDSTKPESTAVKTDKIQSGVGKDKTGESPPPLNTDIIDEAAGTVTRVVKIGSRQLVLQRTTRGSEAVSCPRKIMLSPDGTVDRVLQRDGSCLIEYDQGNPVSVERLGSPKRHVSRPAVPTPSGTSIHSRPGAAATPSGVLTPSGGGTTSTPGAKPTITPVGSLKRTAAEASRPLTVSTTANAGPTPPGGALTPKPLIKTPLASKLVLKLCSALKTTLSPGSPKLSPRPAATPSRPSVPVPGRPETAVLPWNQSAALKRGPRKAEVDEDTRRQALALIRALDANDRRKKKKKTQATSSGGGYRAEEESGDEEFEEEDVYLEEAESGLLLSNSQSWRRVAEVAKDWNSSEEEEEEMEVEERKTRQGVKRKS